MIDLATRHCQACDASTPRVPDATMKDYLAHLPGWGVVDGKLHRGLRFRDFAAALAFVNRIGAIAEAEQHHPDILLHGWNRVDVTIHTHAIGGLSESDFILAAKVSALWALEGA